jgi:hypothetical protein
MFCIRASVCFMLALMLISASAHADVVTIDGKVKAVDAKKRTLTVESDSKTQTLDVSSKAKIRIDDKDASIDSLRAGQKVRLTYHKDLEIVLKVDANSVSRREVISLFDGKTLKGWKTPDSDEIHGFAVKNGEIVTVPEKDMVLLATEEKFDDFEFQCDFWLSKKANSGVYLRGRYEVQLLDDPSYPTARFRCGSIWGQLKPSKSAYHGPKEWNNLLVRLKQNTVTVILNGTTVIDKRHLEKPMKAPIDDLEDSRGPIALQNQDGIARFKNLTIRPLSQ